MKKVTQYLKIKDGSVPDSYNEILFDDKKYPHVNLPTVTEDFIDVGSCIADPEGLYLTRYEIEDIA